MQLFGGFLLVCVFFTISQAVPLLPYRPYHKLVRERPVKLSPEQATKFFAKQFSVAKELQAATAKVCHTNYETLINLPQEIQRACSCVEVFNYLNGKGTPSSTQTIKEIFEDIWKGMNEFGPIEFCKLRSLKSPREHHDVCHCLTGDININ